MPPGESPAPQPGETVKDQVMRTISAVRTRLRAATVHPGDPGVEQPTASARLAGDGDAAGNGSARHGAVENLTPMDPLLLDSLVDGDRNGDETAAHAVVVPDATIVEAPPIVDEPPVVDVPTEVPIGRPALEPIAAPAGTPAFLPAPAAPRARRQRLRPALPLLRRRPRVRKVTRIVRRVDAWGVFKISVIFYVVFYIILLVAGLLLWNLANTSGTVANVEGFVRDLFGLKTFTFDGEKLFRASWVLGAILVVAGTGLNVTMAVLFNLISDLVGGVRVTVLEEEVVLRERPALPPRPVEPSIGPEPAGSIEVDSGGDPLLTKAPRRPSGARRDPAKSTPSRRNQPKSQPARRGQTQTQSARRAGAKNQPGDAGQAVDGDGSPPTSV